LSIRLSFAKVISFSLIVLVVVVYTSPFIGFSIYISAAFIMFFLLLKFFFGGPLKISLKALICIVFAFAVGLFYSLVKSDISSIFLALYMVLSFFVAYFFWKRPAEVARFSLFAMFYLAAWFFYMAIKYGVSGQAINEYLYGASKNYVPFLFLVACSFYYASKIHCGLRYSIIPALFLVGVSVIAGGRSGILVGFLFLLVIFYHLASSFKAKNLYIPFFILGAVFLIFILYFYADELVYLFFGVFESTKFESKGVESIRWEINKEYIYGLDLKGFVLGRNLEEIGLISLVGGNSHNSLIDGHSKMGLFFLMGFSLLVMCPVISMFSSFSSEKLAIYLMLIIVLLSGAVDAAFFYGVFDYLVIYLFFLACFPVIGLDPKSEKSVRV